MGETRVIASLQDVQPGDLCFTRIGGFVPGIIPVAAGQLLLGERVRIGKIRFDHVLTVVEAARGKSPGMTYIDGPTRTDYLPPRGVQAMPDGAEEIELTREQHWNPWTVFCRIPEDWPGQAADAAAVARAMVAAGVEYSFGSYGMLAAWRYGVKTPSLENRINRRLPNTTGIPLPSGRRTALGLPAEAICSVQADQSWTLAGKRVMRNVAPQVVTPGALGMQLWTRAGVQWGGMAVSG